MVSWRDQILKEFTPKVAHLTLVADPDGLLVEEGILNEIRERGFDLIPFEDHVVFRYEYESKFRPGGDSGGKTDLVVVLEGPSSEIESLPYDLLQVGRKLSFNLGDLFPNLTYPVVAELDHGNFDALFRAQEHYSPEKMGDNATKEFILRHVFEIAPELIKGHSDLLHVLLRRHYRGQRIPAILDIRFIQLLRQNDQFREWPLEKIIPNREDFFAFLQERWPVFLDRMVLNEKPGSVVEDKTGYGFKFSGPKNLPFDHDDIRVYIDNMFLEGMLQSISYDNASALTATWAVIGIRIDPVKDSIRRLERLFESIKNNIPEKNAAHVDWFHFAYLWAEMSVLSHELSKKITSDAKEHIESLYSIVYPAFLTWVLDRFVGLHNQPPVPPAMLHHIPRVIAREVDGNRDKKVVFLLVDGLALDQWIVLRNVLQSQQPELCFQESAVFAWIPTITSVSRQAAFAGKPPIYFPASIHTTDKEASLWTQFWADQGLTRNQVTYTRGLGDGNLGKVREILSHPQLRIAGFVIDKIDKIMHGMELGAAGMHNQVHQWAMEGYMSQLIKLLLDLNFQIFLSSDHGNIEAEGCGRPAEGVVADIRGERVRVFPDDLLRAGVKEKYQEAIEWPSIGLPDNYRALLAPNRKAFISKGKKIVSHGGISIEEVIVPLIRIGRQE